MIRYTARYLKSMGFKKYQISGSSRNTKLALKNRRKEGYVAFAIKAGDNISRTRGYVPREIWVRKKR